MNNKLLKIISELIYFCCGILWMYLLVISIFSTGTIGADMNGESHIFYKRDYPIIHIISIGVLLFAINRMKNKITDFNVCKKYSLAVIAVWGIAALLWVLLYTELPEHDPGNVLLAAKQMRQYNFSSFVGEGYMNTWTGNQNLALFFYLLSFLFGIDNFVMLRFLNVAAAVCCFAVLAKTARGVWKYGNRTVLFMLICCGIFTPYFLYMTFIYGDVYGLCLGIMAVCAELKFLGEHKYRWIFAAAALIGISVLLKMNCFIILLAMSAALIYDMILRKTMKQQLIGLLIIIAITAGLQIGSRELIHNITGLESEEGVPLEAWVAMGLQDGVNAAGHYNGYNRQVYIDNGYDRTKTKEQIKNDIRESLNILKNNPDYAFDFYTRKIAAQWATPDCGALSYGSGKDSSTAWIIDNVQTGKLGACLKVFLNIFQTWILFGAICYIWLRKDKTNFEWIFMLIFLGGFIFHLFWEAGSRYAFPYYFMIIPYSAMGLVLFENKAEEIAGGRVHNKKCRKQLIAGVTIMVITVLAGFVPVAGMDGKAASEAEAAGRTGTEQGVKNGYYIITADTSDKLYLTESGDDVVLESGENSAQNVSIYKMYANKIIRFMPSQKTLELAGGDEVHSKAEKNAFEWYLKKIDEDRYYILMNDETALSYNLSDWSVKLSRLEEGNKSQIWRITKKEGQGYE